MISHQSNWPNKRLFELFNIIRGISFPKSAQSETVEEMIACLRTKNVQEKVEFDDLWHVPLRFMRSRDQIVKPHDILISTANSLNLLGKTAFVTTLPEESTFGTFIVLLRAKEGFLAKYLYYGMQRRDFRQQVQQSASTTTNISNISTEKLKQLTIPTPPLPEQERIVARIEELFSDLDKGVEALQTIKAQLKVYRQAVLKEAFEPKSGWVQKTCAEIGEVNLGRQRSPKNVSNNYPTKYIRAANITEQGLDLSDLLEMEFTPNERRKYTLIQGDIVLSEASGSIRQVGKPAIWKNEIEGCCFQNTVIRHRVNGANPRYIFWYYKYCYVSGLFSKIVGGVGINHIGAKNFSELVVPLAPREEQNRIVTEIESRLSVCDKIEQTVDESLTKTESLRQSILKKAFEGKL